MEMMQLLFLASFFFAIFMLLKRTKNSTLNLPPGPPKLPVIGNLHNLASDMPHRAMYKLAQKYGPLMHLQLGEVPAVIVSTPDAAREVLKTHDLNFASRPPLLAAEILCNGASGIVFGPYGEHWRQMRKICTLELLSNKRVQSFRTVREQVYSDLARWVASNEGSPIDLSARLYASTYNVASLTALGKKTKGKARLIDNIKESGELSAGFNIADVYPSITLLRKVTGFEKKLRKLHDEADEIFEDIIREHTAAAAAAKADGKERQEDLVDVLLKLKDNGDSQLTTRSIKSVILDVLAAGSESSATTMDWAMTELLRNPQLLEKAQNEVRQLCDKKGFVDESDVHELNYINSVIKETFRLHIPGPLLLPRMCIQACQINGYDIPVNTRVIVNAWALQRDPQYWDDPLRFNPDRFLESEVDFKGNHFELLPFGAGRRICPGISFGFVNVQLPLATLLYHFDWKLPFGMKPEDIDMSERFGVTTRRENGLCVVPVIKRPLPVA